MNTLNTVLPAFLEANRSKVAAKLLWNSLKVGSDGYSEARAEFLRVDEACEILFGELQAALVVARQTGELDDELEGLADDSLLQLRAALTERGCQSLLNAEPGSFEDLLRNVRKAAALWTAYKQLNRLRLLCTSSGEYVEAACPANCNARLWSRASAAIKRKFDELRALHSDVTVDKIIAHVIWDLEDVARLSYDKQSDALVKVMQRLVETNSFDWEVANLEDRELREMARAFLARVPMLQRQTKPQPA